MYKSLTVIINVEHYDSVGWTNLNLLMFCCLLFPTRFSAMVASPSARQTFISSVVEFLRKYEFDGLDIDWEYPANRGSPPQDKQLYSVLVQVW